MLYPVKCLCSTTEIVQADKIPLKTKDMKSNKILILIFLNAALQKKFRKKKKVCKLTPCKSAFKQLNYATFMKASCYLF